jgi:hypothetical protein
LGLLNMSYVSKFYGYDILTLPGGFDRAFVSNYQVLGYMKAGRMVTLQPQPKVGVTALPGDVPGERPPPARSATTSCAKRRSVFISVRPTRSDAARMDTRNAAMR